MENLSLKSADSVNIVPFSAIYPLDQDISEVLYKKLAPRVEDDKPKLPVGLPLLTSTIGSEGSNNLQFEFPIGLAFDQNSNLYVADPNNKRIQKISSAGLHIKNFGGLDSVQNPKCIAVANNRLYVTGLNAVYILNPGGRLLNKISEDFISPKGITADDEGNIYVTDISKGTAYKFDKDGKLIWKYGTYGAGTGQFKQPDGITFDAVSKNIFIADNGNKRIQKISKNGDFILEIGGAAKLLAPQRAAVDKLGNIFVVESSSAFTGIKKFDSNGLLSGILKADGVKYQPVSISTDADLNLYAAFEYENKVLRFSSTGAMDNTWSAWVSPITLNGPKKVVIDSAGNIYILAKNNSGLFRIVKMEKTIAGYNITELGSIQAGRPESLHVDSTGNLYVLLKPYSKQTLEFCGIQKYNNKGEYLFDYANHFYFYLPQFLKVTAAGDIHVGDWQNYFIFSPAYSYKGTLKNLYSIQDDVHPDQVLFDPSGNYYYLFQNSLAQICKYAVATKAVDDLWGKSQAATGLMGRIRTMVIDASSNIFVINEITTKLIKITADGKIDTVWCDALNKPGTGINLGSVQRMKAGANGKLYLLESNPYDAVNPCKVWEINISDGVIKLLTINPGEACRCIAVDKLNNIFLTGASKVYKYTTAGIYDKAWTDKALTQQTVQADLYDLDTDATGNIYVANIGEKCIYKFDTTGALAKKIGAQATFKYPSSMTSDQQGNLLVLDGTLEKIIKLSPDGTVDLNWSTPVITKTAFKDAMDITSDVSGNIYISDMINNRIQIITKGTFKETFVEGTNPFQNPVSIVADGKGNLFVADSLGTGGLKILKMNEFGKIAQSFPFADIVNSDLSIQVDGSANIYVVCSSSKKVSKFDVNVVRQTVWETTFNKNSTASFPVSLAFNPDGSFYLTDFANKVNKFDSASVFNMELKGGSAIDQPRRVALDKDDNLYVIDGTIPAVTKLFQNGDVAWTVSGKANFDNPLDLAFDSQNNIIILLDSGGDKNSLKYKIKHVNKDSGVVTPWSSDVEDNTIVSQPQTITIDAQGNVYLIDIFRNTLHRLNSLGKIEWSFTKFAEVDMLLRGPESVSIDKDGYVYICDTSNNRVIILDRDGKYYAHWGNWEFENYNLTTPFRISVAPDSSIAIIELNKNYIDRYSPWTGKPLPPDPIAKIVKETFTEIIDNRPTNWLNVFKILRADFDETEKRFNEIENLYNSLATQLGTALSYLEEAESLHRKIFDELNASSYALEEYKKELSLQGINIWGDNQNIEENISLLIDQQTQKLRRMHELADNLGMSQDVRQYQLVNGTYYDQFGVTLETLVKGISAKPDNQDRFLIIPVYDGVNSISSEPAFTYILKNPEYYGKAIHPISIKFEEFLNVQSRWTGVGLGEFSHSINLMPGEQKEIEFTTTKKRSWEKVSTISNTSKSEETSASSYASKRKDNFESALHGAFESNNSFNSKSTSTNKQTGNTNVNVDASYSAGPFKAGGSVDFKFSNSSNNTNTQSQSMETMGKNVRDVVDKTRKDVSSNNKVSFSSTSESSQQSSRKSSGEETETETQKIKVSNINEGKTINYNFFQLMNIYGIKTSFENVNVHIFTGVEIIKDTGITIQRTYEVEDFATALNDLECFDGPQREEIVRMIAIHILRRYFRIENNTIDDQPRLMKVTSTGFEGTLMNRTELKKLVKDIASADITNPDPELQQRLLQFIWLGFETERIDFGAEDTYSVNSGKYYLDTQMGIKEATEPYLETRREIETERQQLMVAELRAKTKKGIFFRDIPANLQDLSLPENSDQ